MSMEWKILEVNINTMLFAIFFCFVRERRGLRVEWQVQLADGDEEVSSLILTS
jgi:hypothetical protein